jgi:ribonuclease T2
VRRVLAAVGLLLAPGVAHAQALSCAAPAEIERPHPELATPDQPQRLLPIGGYTLALTWSPEYCHGRGGERQSAAFECGADARFGFTLHGLWPDGLGKDWPQYCKAAALLPPPVIRAAMCATPSAQLLQHEWAKHGTCVPGATPATYFARSTGLYRALRFPDMDALSRGRTSAGAIAAALARENPGLPAEAVRVTVNRQGWLDELWLCLDKGFRYTRCRAGSGGVPAATAVKVQRIETGRRGGDDDGDRRYRDDR